jgi:Na+/H+-dicarboxylate symporter
MENKKLFLLKTFLWWLPFAAIATIFAGLVYISVQQVLRQGVNDPQIQIAEDMAAQLTSGQNLQTVIPDNALVVDIASSLAPYVVISDEQGQVIASLAELHNSAPVVPSGVFDSVRKYGEARVTWEPEKGVRQALVMTHYQSNGQSGFVMAGRSLREVEKRETSMGVMAGIAWFISMVFCLILVGFAVWFSNREK